jgi:ribosomal protein L12E/L44/L45/RPP1/RPP2
LNGDTVPVSVTAIELSDKQTIKKFKMKPVQVAIPKFLSPDRKRRRRRKKKKKQKKKEEEKEK